MTRSMRVIFISSLISIALLMTSAAVAEPEHFHPKGKMPSKHTLEIFDQARATLPFSDTQDFDEQKKGFIAAPNYKKIMAVVTQVAPLSMSWCLDCHRNPAPHLRPTEEVTNMEWLPSKDHAEFAQQAILEKGLKPPVDCSGCHR